MRKLRPGSTCVLWTLAITIRRGLAQVPHIPSARSHVVFMLCILPRTLRGLVPLSRIFPFEPVNVCSLIYAGVGCPINLDCTKD